MKGAHAQGNTVDMNVGRDLNVQSLQDRAQNSGSSWALGGSIGFDITGMLPGKIAGVDVTKSNGSGLSICGSTSSGSMAWVNDQTSVTGKEKVSIYTEKNTDMKGAVLAADNGNLLLNTGSLSHSNIEDKKKSESASASLAVGGLMKNFVASVDYANSHQEQINRATVGDGLIVIRNGTSASLSTLNCDTGIAQEITQDDRVRMGVFFDSNLANGSTWKAAWTGVNTLVGASYGLLGGVLGGAQAEYKDGVLIFESHPLGAPGTAVTLGQTVIFFEGATFNDPSKGYGSPDFVHLGFHELEQVKQSEVLGPPYLPAYFASGGWWTNSNPFEQGANAASREKMKSLGIYDWYQKTYGGK